MKLYKVTLNLDTEYRAESEEEALGMFWDELHRTQAEEELADIKEIEVLT